MILEWQVKDQLGFCFYLFDFNNDGMICIQDLFNLLKELNYNDQVIREDIKKLISILKEKAIQLRKNKYISPSIYGIYSHYENYDPVSFQECKLLFKKLKGLIDFINQHSDKEAHFRLAKLLYTKMCTLLTNSFEIKHSSQQQSKLVFNDYMAKEIELKAVIQKKNEQLKID